MKCKNCNSEIMVVKETMCHFDKETFKYNEGLRLYRGSCNCHTTDLHDYIADVLSEYRDKGNLVIEF